VLEGDVGVSEGAAPGADSISRAVRGQDATLGAGRVLSHSDFVS
jgi:hypothetical protein